MLPRLYCKALAPPTSTSEPPQSAKVENGDAAVFDAQAIGELEYIERTIDASQKSAVAVRQ
jgi:hypothetical protein